MDSGLSQKLKFIPKETLQLILEMLKPLVNATDNSHGFRLKQVFVNNYAFFAFIYGLLGGIGVCVNLYFLIKIIHLKLYRNSLYYFFTHIACIHLFTCLLILPVSLAVLLLRFWVFGNFMCYALVLLQDLPNRLVLLTFVLIAIDRYRRFAYNVLESFPKHFAIVSIWILSICLTLPACVFVEFFDIGETFKTKKLQGLGLCVINNYSMEEYSRVMFLVLYICPLGVIAFAFTRISMELSKQDIPLNNQSTGFSMLVDTWDDGTSSISVNIDTQNRIQRYLMGSVAVLFSCTLPLNILFLVQCVIVEDDPVKMARFDVLYAVLVWISFVSTITTPIFGLSLLNDGQHVFLLRFRDYINFGDYRKRMSSFALFHIRTRDTSGTLTEISSPATISTTFDNSSQCRMLSTLRNCAKSDLTEKTEECR